MRAGDEAIAVGSFGALLRRFRLAAGLSQEQLAERAGLSADAIGSLERGVRRAPYRATVRDLAHALGLAPDDQAALEAAVARSRRPPAPASTPSPPRNPALPIPPTPFVGRGTEAAQVRALYDQPDVRLVTLCGPGGVGKTRLGLHVAELVAPRFPDGVTFVALAPLRDPTLVASTIAHALGLREAGRDATTTLITYLADKSLLLVLDNFEHLTAAAPVVGDLLTACPGLYLLVTSRATLRVRGEHVYAVPPLPTPDPTHLPPLDDLACIPAVALLVGRARAGTADFALDAANAPAIAALCAHLEGLPLALELAATRLTVLSPALLLRRLDTRLSLLTGGATDLPERQRTLRATLDWSYDLLTPREQAIFRRLAVFRGGCTLEAAETICADGHGNGMVTAEAILDGLAALVDQSLVRREPGAEPRFSMLETVRDYALERLEEGDAAATQARHAAHYCNLAEAVEDGLMGPEQAELLIVLEREADNVRAALEWAREQRAADLGLRLAGALWRYWFLHGNRGEGLDWLESLLAVEPDGEPAVALETRAKALRGAGVLAAELGAYERATSLCGECLDLYRANGDQRGVAAALNVLAIVAKYRGDYTTAAAAFEESLAIGRATGDLRAEAVALNNLGTLAIDRGDHARAVELLTESLRLKRTLGQTVGLATPLVNLGDTLRYQGDLARAEPLYQEALDLGRAAGDKKCVALVLSNLGEAARARGDLARASSLGRESLAMFREMDDRGGIALALHHLGLLASAGDQPGLALRLLGAASALRGNVGLQLPPVDQATYEHTLEAARAALGEDKSAAAWSAGQSQPLEAVIAEAMGE